MTPKSESLAAHLDPAGYCRDLIEDTAAFWLERCEGYLDHEHGGYCHMVDHDGTLIDTDKGVWAQGRNAWLWATLYNTVEARPRWQEAAALGVRFLDEHATDPADGRMWFHTARDGTPLRKRRYAFSEAFAAIAYAAWARLTGEARYADRAVACLDTFTNHVPSPKTTVHRPAVGIAPLMIRLSVAQALRQDIDYAGADLVIDTAVEQISSEFVRPELGAVLEQVSPDGEVIDHVDHRTLNPGHAIEAAWFILEEAHHRGDDANLTELGCRMLDDMWARGWDTAHGGLLYFTDLYNKPCQEYWHDMKFWWPHCEAIIANAMAYRLTGEARYARQLGEVHRWAYDHFHDPAHGEWFGYLHRDGSRSATTKGNLWKSPFHLPRMQWKCWQVLGDWPA